jgi:hypothetical protein
VCSRSSWLSESSVLWHCCLENRACLLEPSVTRGAMGAAGPVYPGAFVSLVFQGESTRSCIRRSASSKFLCVPEALLTTEQWSLEMCCDFRGWGSGLLSCESFFPFFQWLVVSPFADLVKVLLFTGYGTPWMPFGVAVRL